MPASRSHPVRSCRAGILPFRSAAGSIGRLSLLVVLGLLTGWTTGSARSAPATNPASGPSSEIRAPSPEVRAERTDSTKYWIFFTDKEPAPGKKPLAPEPGYVSQEARERRAVRGTHSARWDDRPLSPRYLETLRSVGVRPVVRTRWLNGISAYLETGEIERVRAFPFVGAIRPVARLRPPPPIDRPPAKQYRRFGPRGTRLNYGPSRAQLAAINAISPLEDGYDGSGVVMGFLDTQFNFQHPAFGSLVAEDRLLSDSVFTGGLVERYGEENDNYHGLSVSSVALGNAPGDLIGPARGASVRAATTEYVPREVNQEEDLFVAGLEWLERQGVDLVNSSLGYTTFDEGERSYTYADMDGNTAVTTRAADRAAQKGVVIVASAGNAAGCGGPEAPGCWHYIGSPADGDSVIAVGAIDTDSTRAFFSSFGPTYDGRTKPDVSAPGRSIRAATQGGYTTRFAGTSAASPLVAGVVAQMLQANPRLKPMEIREILRETAHQAAEPDSALGWGIVNAGAAVREALKPVIPETPTLSSARPNPFRSRTTFDVRLPEGPPRTVTLRLYDTLGRLVAEPFRGSLEEGLNTVPVRGTNLPPGVYVYRFSGPNLEATGSVVKLP